MFWLDLHYQLGGKLYGEDAKTVAWNNEAGIKALELIEQLIFEDRVTEPGFLGFSEAMGTGHAAMVYSWSWLGGELNNNYPDLNWGVFRLPTFDGKLAPGPVARNNHETGMSVMKGARAEAKGAAFEFLKWLYEETDYLVEVNLILGTAPSNRISWMTQESLRIHSSLPLQNKCHTLISLEIPYEVENDYGLGMLQDLLFFGYSAADALALAEAEANGVLQERPVKWYVEDLYVPVAE